MLVKAVPSLTSIKPDQLGAKIKDQLKFTLLSPILSLKLMNSLSYFGCPPPPPTHTHTHTHVTQFLVCPIWPLIKARNWPGLINAGPVWVCFMIMIHALRHQMETFSALLALGEASDVELWCFLWSAQIVEQTIETPVIWDAFALIMTSP